jgi:hypothetical protein
MWFKGVWIFQKRLCEGTVTCWKGLYVCVSAPFRQYEEKKNNCLETSAGKIERLLEKLHPIGDNFDWN